VLLNTYYHQTPSLRFPEIIALFADPATRPLTTELAQDQVLLLLALLWQGAAFSRAESARGIPSLSDTALGRGKPRWFAAFQLRELAAFVGFSPKRLGIGLRLLRAMVKWRFVPTAEAAAVGRAVYGQTEHYPGVRGLDWRPRPERGIEHRSGRCTPVVRPPRDRRLRQTRPVSDTRARRRDRGAVPNEQRAAPSTPATGPSSNCRSA
jgi:hypothetical protein